MKQGLVVGRKSENLRQGLATGRTKEHLRQGLSTGRTKEHLRQGLATGRTKEHLRQGLVIRTKTGVSETKLGHATTIPCKQTKLLPKKKTHT